MGQMVAMIDVRSTIWLTNTSPGAKCVAALLLGGHAIGRK